MENLKEERRKIYDEIKRVESKEIDARYILDNSLEKKGCKALDILDIDDDGIKLIEKAIYFCMKKHAGQKRIEGTNYSAHPITVARIVIRAMINDEELNLTEQEKVNVICSALLHDVLEDTETTYEELKNEFGEEIANCVEKVTKPKIKEEGYEEEYFEEAYSDKLSALVKTADRLHNLRTIRAFKERQTEEKHAESVRKKLSETQTFICKYEDKEGVSKYLFKQINEELRILNEIYVYSGGVIQPDIYDDEIYLS